MKQFGVAVRDLLIEKGYTTALGNPNWAAFSERLPSMHYETLRKAVTGERVPADKVMEEVADALEVSPEEFTEYQLSQAQKAFDPREVGDDQALANLEAWIAARPRRAPKGRRRASAA